jgi:site-specific DNA-methyltransferase (adenine-specific)
MSSVDVMHADAFALPHAGRSADVMLVDPPYSAHVHASAVSTRTGGAGPRKRDLGFASLTPELRHLIAGYAAQVARWSAIFCDLEGLHDWRLALEQAGAVYVRAVPWTRWTQPQISGDRPPSGCELIILAHAPRLKGTADAPNKMTWNGPGSLTHFAQKALRGEGKHPTEKPLDLMLALVSYLSEPGEQVFDPCGGSGATAQACRLLGRGCLSLEQDGAWAAAGVARVTAPMSERDAERAGRFIAEQRAEAQTTPKPKAANGSDVKTWERAQRRLRDAATVEAAIAAEEKSK